MTAIAHVGVTVTDLDRAVDWYRDILGFDLLSGPVDVDVTDGHEGAAAADVFGPGCTRFRQAHLTGVNGTALELFEFVEPRAEPRRDNFDYWRCGIFHLCVLAPDIDRVAERVALTGGRMRSARVWQVFDGEPYRFCYCEDPFGNVIELYSHSHERTYANREAVA